MTRSELIQRVAAKHSQLSSKAAKAAVKYVFDEIANTLQQGGRVEIRGFGSFSRRFRKARITRNPKTGAKVRKEGKYSLHFKPGKEMRDRVNLTLQQALSSKALSE